MMKAMEHLEHGEICIFGGRTECGLRITVDILNLSQSKFCFAQGNKCTAAISLIRTYFQDARLRHMSLSMAYIAVMAIVVVTYHNCYFAKLQIPHTPVDMIDMNTPFYPKERVLRSNDIYSSIT